MPGDPFVLSLYAEPWFCELRERLLGAGHDDHVVDRHIGESLTRYRDRRSQDVFPLLIERYVNRALRDNPAKPH